MKMVENSKLGYFNANSSSPQHDTPPIPARAVNPSKVNQLSRDLDLRKDSAARMKKMAQDEPCCTSSSQSRISFSHIIGITLQEVLEHMVDPPGMGVARGAKCDDRAYSRFGTKMAQPTTDAL